MIKKNVVVSMAVIFACSSLLLMSSCAKKHVKAEEEVAKPVPEKKEPVVEKKKEIVPDVEKKKPESDEQKKLAEQEKAKAEKLRREIQSFEAHYIYFDFDKSELKSSARANLMKKAEWLNKNPLYSLLISGHCDERGTNEYNLALGERRANVALKFLSDLGISEDRLTTISYGEERPAFPAHNQAAWAKNRRDEFKLIK